MYWAELARYNVGKDIPDWVHNMFIAKNSCIPGISSILPLRESWESGRKGGERWVGLSGFWGLSNRFELQPEAYGELLNLVNQGSNMVISASCEVHSWIMWRMVWAWSHQSPEDVTTRLKQRKGVLLMRLRINNTFGQRFSDQEC